MSKPTASKRAGADTTDDFAVHFLDVGTQDYGDAVLCEFGSTSVLIDGAHPGNDQPDGVGHPSIQDQIGDLLGQDAPPYRVSLLVVTHPHNDHVGCLPSLVRQELLEADWALVSDPALRWGPDGDDATDDDDDNVRRLAEALREEPLADADDEAIRALLADAGTLRDRYRDMIEKLEQRGTKVVLHGSESTGALVKAFKHVGLAILGPSTQQVRRCSELIRNVAGDVRDEAIELLTEGGGAGDETDLVAAYRRRLRAVADVGDESALDAAAENKGAINDLSIVTRFQYRGRKLLFAGDMQFAEPEVSDPAIDESIDRLRRKIRLDGPYDLVKLSHHGSYNAVDEEFLDEVGAGAAFGICTGSKSKHHPNSKVLSLLRDRSDSTLWVRTDRNGRCTFTYADQGEPDVQLTRGKTNDARVNKRPSGDAAGVADAGTALELAPGLADAATPAAAPITRPDGRAASLTLPAGARKVTVTITVE